MLHRAAAHLLDLRTRGGIRLRARGGVGRRGDRRPRPREPAVRCRRDGARAQGFSLHGQILEQALAGGGTEAFEQGRRAGRSAKLADTVALALS
ncbi:hypothetical protein [Agromyces sp. Marseille-P2726]|uniref:hypothetical protein n=1 Tax=Agromyces sp. Marseille-P2726 TaxID=2709132 RepID=UPI00156FD39E|nr:hypothetical protein [Agromyces sp. Marseille-P2726]